MTTWKEKEDLIFIQTLFEENKALFYKQLEDESSDSGDIMEEDMLVV